MTRVIRGAALASWALLGACSFGACSREPPRAGLDAAADGAPNEPRDAAPSDSGSRDDQALQPDGEGGEAGPKGSVRARVLGLDAAAARRATASVGGVIAAPSPFGDFFVEGVSVGRQVSVFVRAPGFSTAHARVSVRAGELTPVLLELAPLSSTDVSDPSAAQVVSLSESDSGHSLSWPADALRNVYGSRPTGSVQLVSALLEVRLAPAGLMLRGESGTIALRAQALVELRAQQPGAALELSRRATLQLHVSADGDAPELFRFDETSGLFEPAGTSHYDAAAQTLRAEIDRFGIYVAARPATDSGCATGRILDSDGHAVAGAAIRYRDVAGTEAGQVWADETGRYCLPAPAATDLLLDVLGQRDERVFELTGATVRSSEEIAACGAAGCTDAGDQRVLARPLGCVTGRVAKLGWQRDVVIGVLDSQGSESRTLADSVSVKTGQSFCLDITTQRELEVSSAAGLSCGPVRMLGAPERIASCASGGCAELAEVECCMQWDGCANDFDDDCDDLVDEGCSCGADCSNQQDGFPALWNHCCTAANACGFHYPAMDPVDYCFAYTERGRSHPDCPGEPLLIAGQQTTLVGCCRTDNQCGLDLGGTCQPRSELEHLAGASLSPLACAF